MPDVITLPMPSTAHDPVPNLLPPVFRITSITRLPVREGGIYNEADLFHAKASIRVAWMSRQVDTRLTKGTLVGIRWLGKPMSVGGAIRISQLALLERAEVGFNLFDTVPSAWVKDRTLLDRSSLLWQGMSRPFQHLVNAVFWDSHRFHRFLMGPSSLKGHHDVMNGNFRHSVEVAEVCLAMATGMTSICASMLVTAALLHDAGKADEYRMNARRQGLQMSARGLLIGHRHTILEWIAVARATQRVIIPEGHYLGLIHALTAAKGAEWLGVRNPLSLEASILSAADRLSGHHDLMRKVEPDDAGFGEYHPHLKGRPYVLPHDVTAT